MRQICLCFRMTFTLLFDVVAFQCWLNGLRMLLADGCFVAIDIAKAIDIQAYKLVAIQGGGPGNQSIVYRQLDRCEGALIDKEGIGSGPIQSADNDVVSIAAYHLPLIIDATKWRITSAWIVNRSELAVLINETVAKLILVQPESDYYAVGIDPQGFRED